MYINNCILGLGVIFTVQSQVPQEFKKRSCHLQKDQGSVHGSTRMYDRQPRQHRQTRDKDRVWVLWEEHKKKEFYVEEIT